MMLAIYAHAYARALFSTAKACGRREPVTADMRALKAQWEGAPELHRFAAQRLRGNTLSHERLIDEIWGESFGPELIQLLKVLAHRNQLTLIPLIVKHFMDLFNRDLKREQVVGTFALAPDDAELARIRQLIAKRFGENYELIVKTDPKLIAGFTLIMNDTCVDASLAGRLTRLKLLLKKPAIAG